MAKLNFNPILVLFKPEYVDEFVSPLNKFQSYISLIQASIKPLKNNIKIIDFNPILVLFKHLKI